MNWNEEQLLSWRPRPASNKLKARIFAAPHPRPAAKWFWGALVPATACALLSLMTVNHGGDSYANVTHADLSVSELNASAQQVGNRQSAQNHNDIVTFDSTNKNVFNSNVHFTLATNFSH